MSIKSYKGFNQDMTCRGFQFEEGKEYEVKGPIQACKKGFHACEAPLDCFGYYAPADSVYHEVEQDGKISRKGDDTKVASSKIKIGARVDIAGLVKAQIEWVKNTIEYDKAIEKANQSPYDHATGDRGAASATGTQGAASATGYQGAASATGDRGAASATGTQGAASATGYRGAASATGYQGAASATGYQGAASATGYQGAASATGLGGIAIAAGFEGKVSGALGCAIVCCERGDWDGTTYPLLSVVSAIVDGEKIKADTWYTVKNGEFVEVKND